MISDTLVEDEDEDVIDVEADGAFGAQVTADLTEEEAYLFAILTDASGLDLAEFTKVNEESPDSCWRAYPYQWAWWRCQDRRQADRCARATGKSESIEARAGVFPFVHPGQEMVITAPEGIHAETITDRIEGQLTATRLLREMIIGGRSGISHKPFKVRYKNRARIIGRIPQKSGIGIKSTHPVWLELDEASDYPERGWVEIRETLRRELADAQWRCHGVLTGVPNEYHKVTVGENSGFTVHWFTALHKPGWNDQEREEKVQEYGSASSPEYRRNIMGLPGDASNAIFVLSRLMLCLPAGTDVWVEAADGSVCLQPIEDVKVSTRVRNAIGVGTVLKAQSSCHTRLVRLGIDGEHLYCSPDHPVLTRRGWVSADCLVAGDRLVTHSDMRALWRPDDRTRQAILFDHVRSAIQDRASEGSSHVPRVLGSDNGEGLGVLLDLVSGRERPPQASPAVRDMRGAAEGRPVPILHPGVLRVIQADSAAVSGVSQLRSASRWTRPAQILQHRVRVPSHVSRPSREAVRTVRPTDHQSSFLLEIVHREIRWDEVPWIGHPETNDGQLRPVRRLVLPSIKEGQVLLPRMRAARSTSQAARSEELPVLWRRVQAEAQKPELLRTAVRSQATKGQLQGQPGGASGSGRPVAAAVRTVEAIGRRVVSGILGVAPRRSSRNLPLSTRSGLCNGQDSDRGGRAESQLPSGRGEGRDARRLVMFPRLDSVAVLQRGDPDFDRLSRGSDSVVCYDLTVSGHPSFAVGRRGYLVHNCVDKDQGSEYNTDEYWKREIRFESIEDLATKQHLGPDDYGRLLVDMLDFPPAHRQYKITWAGMDVGISRDPSEILVFGEYSPSAAERRRDEKVGIATPLEGLSRLKLLTRLHLMRFPTTVQVEALLRVVEFYRPKAFTMDSTGNGLGVLQQLQQLAHRSRIMRVEFEDDEDEQDPKKKKAAEARRTDADSALTVIKGYNFGGKVIVEIDEEKAADLPPGLTVQEVAEKAGIKRLVKEYATDQCRELVDQRRALFPWDDNFIEQMNGQTFVYSSEPTDQYGNKRRVYSRGVFHAFDGFRMAAIGRALQPIEQLLKAPPKKRAPVYDRFL